MESIGPAAKAFWEDVLKLPARILAVGGSVLLLAWIADLTVGARFRDLLGTTPGDAWPQLIIGILVFLIGIGLAVFLWWLTARFFGLIDGGKLDGAGMAAVKDLPMGLPEGTVRAILALVVAMVGLPLLLFYGVLKLDPAIAGYINGIITGVFGFYFGTRTTGVPAQAVEKIAGAQQQAMRKTEEAATAIAQAASARSDADAARTDAENARSEAAVQVARAQGAVSFDSTLGKVGRHLALADTVLKVFAPVLPPGVIPAGAADLVAGAEKTVAALQGVTASTATSEQIASLANVADALTGGESPVGALLKTAAPLLANLSPIPALGPVAGLVALLGLGAKLGSSQFQRWRARVLAAPLGQGLVEFGSVTPELIHAALRQAPRLHDALATRPAAEVDSFLANVIEAADGADQLMTEYGPQGRTATGLILDAEHARAGLDELGQALLSLYSVNDVQDTTVRQVADALSSPIHPDLASSSAQSALRSISASDANRLIDAAAGISNRPDTPLEQRAAFDGLVTLVDAARRQNIDLVATLGELHP